MIFHRIKLNLLKVYITALQKWITKIKNVISNPYLRERRRFDTKTTMTITMMIMMSKKTAIPTATPITTALPANTRSK